MVRHRSPVRASLAAVLSFAIGLVLLAPVMARPDPGLAPLAPDVGAAAAHLVISELATGGASASDEFVELYNPTAGDLLLDGLELVYASASGLTITRKAAWESGSAAIPAGRHVLVANAAGAYAATADATYANGLAATGGSVALRAIDTQAVLDAVGWGSATAWLEGDPAVAPPAGSSLERLPGGAAGSGQDTDDNAADFAVRESPDPQNAASDPVPAMSPTPTASPSPTPTVIPSPTPSPSTTPTVIPSPTPTPSATPTASPSPTPTASPSPTTTASPSPTPTPTPAPISIVDARALPDGSVARISGTALMGSDVADGGGCVDDGTGGIAVLPDGATFARGATVMATGVVDDRYAQRTLRVSAGELAIDGTEDEPAATTVETGSVGEPYECRLVRLAGLLQGSPTELSSGLAFDLDDGSGAVRVLVAPASGIDTAAWTAGTSVTVVGVVGQRDSSGTGTAGYRVQPRDTADVEAVVPPATPAPSASPSATPAPSASPSPALKTIAQARAAATGASVRVRGVVTLPTGLVDAPTAVIQDATGAIVVRLGDEAGSLQRGLLVEVTGTRSTKAGMATIRTDQAPLVLAGQAEPSPQRGTTGGLGETSEARLVIVRGAVTSAVTRSTAGNTAFTLDDGSGALRVTLFAAAGVAADAVERGSWIEVIAVLGQETTGALPDRGYRLWPRGSADLRLVAPATNSASVIDPAGGSNRAAIPSPGRSTGADRSSPSRQLDLVVPRIGRQGGSPGTRAVGTVPSDQAPASGELMLAAATARSVHVALVGVVVALMLGLLMLAGWRAGTAGRLRETLVARVAANVDAAPDEPG